MTLLRYAPAVVIASAIAIGCGSKEKMHPEVPETTSAQSPGTVPSLGNARSSNPNMEPSIRSGATTATTPTANDENRSQPTMATSDATGGAPTTAGLTDDQILQALHVTNTAAVDQAKLAQTKAKNLRVKQFAASMVRDHTEADAKGYDMARGLKVTLADSTLANQLQTDGQRTVEQLRAQSGADFDQAYIDAQIMSHREALNTIDKRLLPNAKSAEVRQHLETLRAKVDSHLREAQTIRSSFNARSNP